MGSKRAPQACAIEKDFSLKMETTGIVEGCQEAATELGRNEEQHVSRHRGKNKKKGVE